jgi:hypothetical protein
MYPGVPTIMPAWVAPAAHPTRATPKSMIFTASMAPSGRKRLAGLRSR